MELITIYVLSVLVTRIAFAVTENEFNRFEFLISIAPLINLIVTFYLLTYGKEK
jgi:hypothetical protein